MAYNCIACVEANDSRFVFTDLDDGNVASVCLGHAPAFLLSAFMETCRMTDTDPAEFLASLGPAEAEQEAPAEPIEPVKDVAARRRSTRKLEAVDEPSEDELVSTE